MPLHAYITSLCRKDIAAHNLETYIERLVAKLEQEGAHNLQRYPNNLLKKQPGDNLRLIIQEIPVDDALVLAFLRVMPRGSKEYERFMLSRYDRAALPGYESLERETSPDNLRNFIASRARPLPPPPPAPSEREARILYAIRQRHNRLYNDFHVCETELWTRTVKDPRIRTDLSRLADTVLRCMDAPDVPLAEIRCEQENQLGVLCRRVQHEEGHGPKIVLFAAFFGGAPREEVRKRYEELLQDTPPSHEACLRRAKNVYPLELAFVRDA